MLSNLKDSLKKKKKDYDSWWLRSDRKSDSWITTLCLSVFYCTQSTSWASQTIYKVDKMRLVPEWSQYRTECDKTGRGNRGRPDWCLLAAQVSVNKRLLLWYSIIKHHLAALSQHCWYTVRDASNNLGFHLIFHCTGDIFNVSVPSHQFCRQMMMTMMMCVCQIESDS